MKLPAASWRSPVFGFCFTQGHESARGQAQSKTSLWHISGHEIPIGFGLRLSSGSARIGCSRGCTLRPELTAVPHSSCLIREVPQGRRVREACFRFRDLPKAEASFTHSPALRDFAWERASVIMLLLAVMAFGSGCVSALRSQIASPAAHVSGDAFMTHRAVLTIHGRQV